jgi:hypothetical protein
MAQVANDTGTLDYDATQGHGIRTDVELNQSNDQNEKLEAHGDG